MSRFTKIALFSVALVTAQAQAELVASDWLVAGDQRATLDTASGLEWLDLNETFGLSFNEVQSQLDSTFAGWRLPTAAEVDALMTGQFGPLATGPNVSAGWQSSAIQQWQSLMGETGFAFNGLHLDHGNRLIYSGVDPRGIAGGDIMYFDNRWVLDFDTVYGASAVWLVSDGGLTLSSRQEVGDVPAPLGLGALTLAGLIGWRRRRP